MVDPCQCLPRCWPLAQSFIVRPSRCASHQPMTVHPAIPSGRPGIKTFNPALSLWCGPVRSGGPAGSAVGSNSLLGKEFRDVGQVTTINERIGMAMDTTPAAVRSVKDFGHPQVPSTLGADGITHELDGGSLDERQPGNIAIGPAVQELDAAGPPTPLRSDDALPLACFDATATVTSDRAEDRSIGGQLVTGAITVDPRLVVTAAFIEQQRQDGLVGHRHSLPPAAGPPSTIGRRRGMPVSNPGASAVDGTNAMPGSVRISSICRSRGQDRSRLRVAVRG